MTFSEYEILSPCACEDDVWITVSACPSSDERGSFIEVEDVPKTCPFGHHLDYELVYEEVYDLLTDPWFGF